MANEAELLIENNETELDEPKKKRSSSLKRQMSSLVIVPLVFLGIVLGVAGTSFVSRSITSDTEKNLENIASIVWMLYDKSMPGDMRMETAEDGSITVYKGDVVLNDNYEIVDAIKEETDLDTTLFYMDTRIATTLRRADGTRYVATGASQVVLRDVFDAQTPKFYSDVDIDGTSYFAYYMPVFNSDNQIVGMIFVAKPRAEMQKLVGKAIAPLIAIDIALMILMLLIVINYGGSIIKRLSLIRKFVHKTSMSRLDEEMPYIVTRYDDEIGQMGNEVVKMQKSLKDLIEIDGLTRLYNRRTGETRFKRLVAEADTEGNHPVVCIGDIDFFKKVNDTYGHDGGDAVLRNVSALLKQHMSPFGFACRWGGEEMLLVFYNVSEEEAEKELNKALDKIRALEVVDGQNIIKVTMSFGVTAVEHMDAENAIKLADANLYYAKENGRNRVVSNRTINS